MKQTKIKTKTISKRVFSIYNEDEELLDTFETADELREAYNFSANSLIYSSINLGIFVKPNIRAIHKYRIEYKKYEKEVIVPLKFTLKEYERETIQDLPGELWRQIPGYKHQYCSNMGRFKYIDAEGNESFIPLLYSINKTSKRYRDINLHEVGPFNVSPAKRYRTSRVLAKTWIDSTLDLDWNKDKRNIDHIDNDSNNERVINLRIVSHSDNIRAAIYQQGKDVGRVKKKCYAYNIDTKEVREYESTGKLVQDIFGKSNNGWFSNYSRNKSVNKDGWVMGYDLEEIKTYVRREGGRK